MPKKEEEKRSAVAAPKVMHDDRAVKSEKSHAAKTMSDKAKKKGK